MKKFILTLALPLLLLSNANASEWQDILNAANSAASPQTKQSLNKLLHKIKPAHPPAMLNQGQTLPANQLTQFLMQGAGVTQTQAQGGTGALLQLAQRKMNTGDFTQLTQAIPDWQSFLSAVPALQQQPSALTGLAKLAGNSNGTVGNLLTVVSAFQQLGITPEQMQQFLPLLLEYLNSSQGGSTAAQLLNSALLR